MKGTFILLCFLFSSMAMAGWKSETRAVLREYSYACKNTEVTIDSITPNEYIRGHISGLPTEAFDKFKMVFYVKTNVWYVHPYSYYDGQQEGYSYSNLDSNGHFQVKTVKRAIPSKELAAVLVPKAFKIKDQRWWLRPLFGFIGGLVKFNCSYVLVEGNGDF